MYVLSIACFCIQGWFGSCSMWRPSPNMALALHVGLLIGEKLEHVLSVNTVTPRRQCGSRAQVTVGIMMAPVMHLTHCESIPLVLLARAKADKVRPCVIMSRLAAFGDALPHVSDL